jgi:hypothetical protein
MGLVLFERLGFGLRLGNRLGPETHDFHQPGVSPEQAECYGVFGLEWKREAVLAEVVMEHHLHGLSAPGEVELGHISSNKKGHPKVTLV